MAEQIPFGAVAATIFAASLAFKKMIDLLYHTAWVHVAYL